ncbi:YoaK family protein [Massilia sp. TN1-12]|uniref:YoaK family protein n=1 Tax=Massilia paldalensis TaxID=3377675 RepID=UPI00384C5301
MPIAYIRALTSHARSPRANRHLGCALAFVAGAINAGGFLAVRQYTSHMTGIVSAAADRLALGAGGLALDALGALLCFLLGAACTAVMVHHARRHALASEYALPLLLEAALLLVFGMLGARLAAIDFVPAAVMLLCFMMGLQNALVTKLSQAEIRTTHMTGIVTDLGIELGKLAYWHRGALRPTVAADRARLRLLALLLLCFFAGGVGGALGFAHAGYLATVPLALFLCGLAIVPALDDLHVLARRAR